MKEKQVEFIEREALEKLQLDRLKKTVERAFNKSPFYRNILKKAGIKPADIRCIDDIKILPFTRKEDLTQGYFFQ